MLTILRESLSRADLLPRPLSEGATALLVKALWNGTSSICNGSEGIWHRVARWCRYSQGVRLQLLFPLFPIGHVHAHRDFPALGMIGKLQVHQFVNNRVLYQVEGEPE